MLKKIAYSTLVLIALSGCATHSHQPQQVYVERQVIVPNYHRAHQCNQYADRERNCWNLQYRDTRAMCIEDARQHYQNCMYR